MRFVMSLTDASADVALEQASLPGNPLDEKQQLCAWLTSSVRHTNVTLDSKGGERVTQACRYVMVDGRREANPTVVSFITLNVVALFML